MEGVASWKGGEKVAAAELFQFGRFEFEEPNLFHFGPKSGFDRIESFNFKREFAPDFSNVCQILKSRFSRRDDGDVGPFGGVEKMRQAVGFEVGDETLNKALVDVEIDESLCIAAKGPFPSAERAEKKRIARHGASAGDFAGFGQEIGNRGGAFRKGAGRTVVCVGVFDRFWQTGKSCEGRGLRPPE